MSFIAPQSIRESFRKMRRQPFFTLTIVGLFGLAIGTNTLLFSILDAVVLQATPFPNASQILGISCNTEALKDGHPFSVPVAAALRGQSSLIEDLGYYRPGSSMVLGQKGAQSRIAVTNVSSSFFSTLGRWPSTGRWFIAIDNEEPQRGRVILSDSAWHKYFQGNPGIVGGAIVLDNTEYTAVGVMPPDFAFPDTDTDAWVLEPLTLAVLAEPGRWDNAVVARLKEGVTQKQLRTELDVISSRLAKDNPANNQGLHFDTTPILQVVLGSNGNVIWMLFFVTVFVVALITANIVNLLVANNFANFHEQMIRLSLGAQRSRLLRDYVAGHFLYAIAGGILGLIVAYLGLQGLRVMGGISIPRWELTGMGARVWIYAASSSCLVYLACGLFSVSPLMNLYAIRPAWGHSVPLDSKMGRTVGRRLQTGSTILQVALALVLLLMAGSAISAVLRLIELPLGFDSNNLLFIQFVPRASDGLADVASFFHPLLDDLKGLPGVENVAVSSFPPLEGPSMQMTFKAYDPRAGWGLSPLAQVQTVSPDYFRVMKMSVLHGRSFQETDSASTNCAVIANETFVRKVWGTQAVLGHLLSPTWQSENTPPCSIIGVVADIRDVHLEQTPGPELYFSDLQRPDSNKTVLIRANHSERLVSVAKELVKRHDAGRQIMLTFGVRQFIVNSTQRPRAVAYQLGVLAIAAVLISITGIYSMTTQFLKQRRAEIGVRLAMGAQTSDLSGMVFRQFGAAVGAGVAMGIIICFTLVRLLAAFVSGAIIVTIPSILWSGGILCVFIFFACLQPVVTAKKYDISSLLRSE